MESVLQNFYLLQSVSYFKEDDPTAAIILLGGVGAVIVIGLVVNFARHGIGTTTIKSRGGKAGGTKTTAERRFSIFQLHRTASYYGFNREQTKLLEYVFKTNGVTNPQAILQNTASLDKHLKRAYRNIERKGESEQEVQNFQSLLFSIRNTVEAVNQSATSSIDSTKKLSENMSGVLSVGKNTSYPTQVLSSRGEHLLIETPLNAIGSPMRIPSNTKVAVSFFTKSSQGFAFNSQILGSVSTPKGHALQLAHSGRPVALAKRRYKRREVMVNCEFSMLQIQEAGYGRKKERKMVVEPRRYKGTILDLSAGGCAIKAPVNVQAGSNMKIGFQNSEGNRIAAVGQILRINQSKGLGIVMNIKFLKITRKSLNSINAMVFEYDQD